MICEVTFHSELSVCRLYVKYTCVQGHSSSTKPRSRAWGLCVGCTHTMVLGTQEAHTQRLRKQVLSSRYSGLQNECLTPHLRITESKCRGPARCSQATKYTHISFSVQTLATSSPSAHLTAGLILTQGSPLPHRRGWLTCEHLSSQRISVEGGGLSQAAPDPRSPWPVLGEPVMARSQKDCPHPGGCGWPWHIPQPRRSGHDVPLVTRPCSGLGDSLWHKVGGGSSFLKVPLSQGTLRYSPEAQNFLPRQYI